MRKLFAVSVLLLLLCTTSLMAQHGEYGKRGERIEKIIEIVGGPGGGHGQRSFGQAGGHGECGSFGHGLECGQKADHSLMMTHRLDLSEEQQTKMKKMRLEFDLKMVDAHAALKKARLKLKALTNDDESSESKVFSAIDKVAEREADIRKMKYANRQKMHSILTKEQLEKAKGMRFGHGGDHKVFQWYGDGSKGDKTLIEFHGDGTTIDKDGNTFIIKREYK